MRKPNTVCCVCHKPIYKRPWQMKQKNWFCGNECYRKFRPAKTHICEVCGKEYKLKRSVPTRTCSRVCAGKLPKGNGGVDLVLKNRAMRKELASIRGNKCEDCGFSKYVEILIVHHIIGRAVGGPDTPENTVLLCPNCHAIRHSFYDAYGKLKPLDR